MRKKTLSINASIILCGIAVLFLAGPRVPLDETINTVIIPEDLGHYLRERESHLDGLIPGTEKKIVWADSTKKEKTPLSMVYLHGFSATRRETEPLCDIVARNLGANLFYTRLTGHGLDGAALGEATVNDWLNDAAEALEIGRRLGDNVVVVGTSTGGTLATWLASRNGEDMTALVLLAPNFGLKNPASEVLLLPWAVFIAPLLVGPDYNWEPVNPRHAEFWTESYPTKALIPMMGLVDIIRKTDLTAVSAPVFAAYSPDDRIVDSEKTEKTLLRFGSNDVTRYRIVNTRDPQHHIIAGDILAPENTETVAREITQFIMRVSP
ncbi:alpha/beta hydrolase [Candidatus Latescibacterota bacterium]